MIERRWALVFVFAISLLAVGMMLFLAATHPAVLKSSGWGFWMLGALFCAIISGAVSLDRITRIATRDGSRPLATPP